MPTVILRPTSDYTSETSTLSKSSGNNYYSLINEEVSDDDSSYIYTDISSTTSISNVAYVVAKWAKKTPIKLTSIKIHLTSKTTSSNSNDSKQGTYQVFLEGTDIQFNGSPISDIASDNRVVCGNAVLMTDLTSSYTERTKVLSLAGMYAKNGSDQITPTELIVNNFSLGTTYFVIRVSLSGQKKSSKNDSFQNRITQVYLEVTYEDVEATTGFYLKQNGAYAEAQALYQKVNGVWVACDKTAFNTTTKYKHIKT